MGACHSWPTCAGNVIGSPRSDKGTRRCGDLRLWTSSDLCLPRHLDCCVSTIGDICQLDQRSRWNGTELMQARILESTDDRDSIVRKVEGSRVDLIELQRTVAV